MEFEEKKYNELSKLKDDYRETYKKTNEEINKLNALSIPNGDVIIQEAKLKSALSKIKETTDAIIDCYEDILSIKEREIYSLENDGYVIGDYDELKRILEINNLWNENLEYVLENVVKFNNTTC